MLSQRVRDKVLEIKAILGLKNTYDLKLVMYTNEPVSLDHGNQVLFFFSCEDEFIRNADEWIATNKK